MDEWVRDLQAKFAAQQLTINRLEQENVEIKRRLLFVESMMQACQTKKLSRPKG